jgi:hypothetical protein
MTSRGSCDRSFGLQEADPRPITRRHAVKQERDGATDGREHLLEATLRWILRRERGFVGALERIDRATLALEEGRDQRVLVGVQAGLVDARCARLEEVGGIRHRSHEIVSPEQSADAVAVDRQVADVERRAIDILHGHPREHIGGDRRDELLRVANPEFGAGKDDLDGQGKGGRAHGGQGSARGLGGFEVAECRGSQVQS